MGKYSSEFGKNEKVKNELKLSFKNTFNLVKTRLLGKYLVKLPICFDGLFICFKMIENFD